MLSCPLPTCWSCFRLKIPLLFDRFLHRSTVFGGVWWSWGHYIGECLSLISLPITFPCCDALIKWQFKLRLTVWYVSRERKMTRTKQICERNVDAYLEETENSVKWWRRAKRITAVHYHRGLLGPRFKWKQHELHEHSFDRARFSKKSNLRFHVTTAQGNANIMIAAHFSDPSLPLDALETPLDLLWWKGIERTSQKHRPVWLSSISQVLSRRIMANQSPFTPSTAPLQRRSCLRFHALPISV